MIILQRILILILFLILLTPISVFAINPHNVTFGEIKAQHIPTKSHYQLFYQQTEKYTLVYCLS